MAAPKGKDEDVRLMAALATFGVTSIVFFSVILLAPPVKVGPSEGELAPDFTARRTMEEVGTTSACQSCSTGVGKRAVTAIGS